MLHLPTLKKEQAEGCGYFIWNKLKERRRLLDLFNGLA
jgi:hypothetical protein